MPDGVFGIEYRTSEGKSYRFFAVEVDRGTMPISRSKTGQTSYLGKLAGYRQIVEGHVHKTHWGVPNLFVLTLTVSTARVAEIVGKLGTEGCPVFLFKAVDETALVRPVPQLLREPWTRAGLPPLSIAEAR